MNEGCWRIAAASATGTSHVALGRSCQDYHIVETVRGADGKESLIACLADGAGSAARSDVGAQIACRTWIQRMRIEAEAGWKLRRQVGRKCVDVARNALVARAILDDAPLAEYACTLLGICIRSGQSQFVQIGDGAIVIRSNRPSAKYEPVFWPDQGEYANTTSFLTDEGGRVLLKESISVPEIGEVALFSDGLQRLALDYETKSAFGPFFDTMFSHLRGALPHDRAGLSDALSQFLDSEAVNQRTDDDKTLVLATRLEEGTDASAGS